MGAVCLTTLHALDEVGSNCWSQDGPLFTDGETEAQGEDKKKMR